MFFLWECLRLICVEINRSILNAHFTGPFLSSDTEFAAEQKQIHPSDSFTIKISAIIVVSDFLSR